MYHYKQSISNCPIAMNNYGKRNNWDVSFKNICYVCKNRMLESNIITVSTTIGQQIIRNNEPADSPEHSKYYRRSICLPLLDHFIAVQLDTRFFKYRCVISKLQFQST